MRRLPLVVTVATLLAAAHVPAAQMTPIAGVKAVPAESAPPAGAPDVKKTPSAPRKPPPYEAPLLRLAEMAGALAYLRDLCGAGDGAIFRAKLETLIKAEGIGEETRDLVAGAYNEAYRGYSANYRTCTPAANQIIARFLKEAEHVASDVAARFGGG